MKLLKAIHTNKMAPAFPYVLVLALTLISLWPFFRSGFFETHDGDWMIIRFSAFHQALVDGQFPVRFVDRLNNNYGYPVLNFLYPLPFYLAEIPKILGFGFVQSIKLVFVASTIASSTFMYWALSRLFSKKASIVGAVLYVWVPYRFLDIYVRGSVGESLAFAFIPLVLGSIFLIQRNKKFYYPMLSLSTAFLILSHNVIAVMFLPILFLISLVIDPSRIIKTFLAFTIGLILSAFFWLPALYDIQFVILSRIKISNVEQHLVSLKSLVIPSWGYGPTPSNGDFFSPQLGMVTITVLLFSIIFILKKKLNDKLSKLLIVISIFVVFMLHKVSLPLWTNIPLIDTIQFPWRALSIVVFSSSILASMLVEKINKNFVTIFIVIFAILLSSPYTHPKNFVQRDEGFYSTNEDTTTVRDEYLPIWVQEKPNQRAYEKLVIIGKGNIASQEIKNASYKADINLQENSTIKVNTIFFPGWQVFANGKTLSINVIEKTGLISFELPKGEHKVIIDYNRTGIHLVSELLSLLALIVISVQFYLWRKQNSL